MQKLVFSCCSLVSNSFLEIIHEALLNSKKTNIDILVKSSPNKKHKIIINSYQINNNEHELYSVFNKTEKYSLVSFNSLISLLAKYNVSVTNIDLMIINTIIRCAKNSQKSSDLEELLDVSPSETRKTRETKKTREKETEDMIDYLEYKKKYEQEETKVETKVEKTEAELKEEEKLKLEKQLEKNKKREEELKNRFLSEKGFTYQKLYNDFFIEKKIKDWDNLPELFKCKFPVYLFMDGKGIDGKDSHERLLDTEDEFTIFKYLYDVITNDDFEMPEDDKYIKIINEFVENLPPIKFLSEDDIMKLLNDPNDDLFEQDNTSQKSGDDPEDVGGNNTYER